MKSESSPATIDAYISDFPEEDALSAYDSAKGSVQFPLDSPIPYDLVKRIVKFRVKECRAKIPSKSEGKKRSKPA